MYGSFHVHCVLVSKGTWYRVRVMQGEFHIPNAWEKTKIEWFYSSLLDVHFLLKKHFWHNFNFERTSGSNVVLTTVIKFFFWECNSTSWFLGDDKAASCVLCTLWLLVGNSIQICCRERGRKHRQHGPSGWFLHPRRQMSRNTEITYSLGICFEV